MKKSYYLYNYILVDIAIEIWCIKMITNKLDRVNMDLIDETICFLVIKQDQVTVFLADYSRCSKELAGNACFISCNLG